MDIALSEHFMRSEFEKGAPIPQECVASLMVLCQKILDPTRDNFGVPFIITSGYRTPEANLAAHGQPNSEHVYTADHCAADFYAQTISARPIFDWMRNNPTLPFHQLILEHGANGSSIIHVSYNRTMPEVRSVLEGATHNSEPYTKVDYVPFTA